jgi:hypothetical protein
VTAMLSDAEHQLWLRMARPDRRHAVGVARRVEASLAGRAASPADDSRRAVLAAALLHDVGKLDADLGTLGRVATTMVTATGAGRRWATRAGTAEGRGPLHRPWRHPSQWQDAVAAYRDHPRIGGAYLRAAGSPALTVAWAAEHHQRPERWTVPLDVATALHAADDD